MEATKEAQSHIAILPSPGMGHLIPLTEFAKRLILHHNFLVTFIVPSDGSPMQTQKTFLESLPASMNSICLAPPSFDDLPEETKIETRIALTITRSLPEIREALELLSKTRPICVLVVDLFGSTVFDLAKDLSISTYMFFTSTAMSLSLLLHLPKLDQNFTCEYRELVEPVKLPGCVPLLGKDFLDAVQDRKNEAYKLILELCRKYSFADGILVNSFMELEFGAFESFKEEGWFTPLVYPVGPLIQTRCFTSEVDSEMSDCLKWLNKQPPKSVLFIAFGSGGTLSPEQINELALGLEMSEQRFLWVVRSPHETANAAFFNIKSKKDPFNFLPKGFLEKIKEKGLVVASWAPQIEVLSHGSTGGFLSHCGWNSVLESIVHGVPLIAWPLYAEQKMNAVLLTEGLKAALRVKVDENGLVGKEQIAKLGKDLIEGEDGKDVRNKMKELKDGAERAFRQDGYCSKSLAEVAQNMLKINPHEI